MRVLAALHSCDFYVTPVLILEALHSPTTSNAEKAGCRTELQFHIECLDLLVTACLGEASDTEMVVSL
jgi:hypothetical protein